MRIRVVIPTFNEAETVARAISSARAPGVEIVVVDGGSRDETCEILRSLDVLLLESPPGRARQLETGWRGASAEVLLFLHADSCLPEGYVEAISNWLRDDPEAVGGAFRFCLDSTQMKYRWVTGLTRFRNLLFQCPYGDQAIFVRRSILEEIGGIPQVPIMEDLDLVELLKRKGRFRILPLEVRTSVRRYERGGLWTVAYRNRMVAWARKLGLNRSRIARWYLR